ncbi:nose resistant to fluoxetine protein 6 [Rhipicephalus sanguineus]|uniref:nose resistant to fluoxetine protein 6 n=1 Tax=Rhipicephalus sanguineus TaxID=34632 RepID=UPI0020C4855B|nr:nose resistant to fluoxetine protein 6 [Rhipicephalus sanguineus]
METDEYCSLGKKALRRSVDRQEPNGASTADRKHLRTTFEKTIQALLWCIALSCGLGCVFMKLDWNINGERASETKRMVTAFIDRILWSVCIAWFWFTCTTGRGGFVNRFLSWNGFVPLGRLSFGVYLIHLPFYNLMHRISRERRFFSHFVLVSNCFVVLVWSYILSYILCVTCELPTAHLEKLVFVRDPKKGDGTMKEPQKQQQVMGEDVANITVVSINQGTSKNCCDQG